MKIISYLESTGYNQPGHPEAPFRIRSSYEFLKEKGFEFIEPQTCSEGDILGDILTVHAPELLRKVKEGNFYDPDTPNLPKIFDYARLAAGAAIQAQALALKGLKAFSLMRPPGHHASKNHIGGFCYFNNMAIATKCALGKVNRIVLLDIDVHHGNGTQDIFLGEEKVLFVSLHQSPLYPGTGLVSENNCLNFPLSSGVGPQEYLEIMKIALERIKEFRPEIIGISAGFDTFKEDPLGGLKLEEETYREIGGLISGLNKPIYAVLEGGYSQKLKICIYQFLLGLGL